jgi:hypothetical protein
LENNKSIRYNLEIAWNEIKLLRDDIPFSNRIYTEGFMKLPSRSLILIFIMLVLSCKIQKSEDPKNNTTPNKINAVTKFDSVRIRKKPDTNSPIIVILTKGETVDILQKTDQKTKLSGYPEDYWYEVNTKDDNKGWVFGALIDIVVNSISTDKTPEKKDNSSTGKKESNWKISSESKINTKLTASGNMIFFGRTDDNLYAVDIFGKQKWKFSSGGQINDIVAVNDEDIVVITQKCIYCIKMKSGLVKWQYKTNLSSNVIFKDNIIFADKTPEIAVLDMTKGTVINRININFMATSIALINDAFFIYDEKGDLYPVSNQKNKGAVK